MIAVRPETPEDIAAIYWVEEQAFSRPGEAQLVDLLRAAGKATISLVAEIDGVLAGHVLFSPVAITPEPRPLAGLGLGPVAVLPEYQRRGIGSRMIVQGLDLCRQLRADYSVVLGNPRYYSRFGYTRASLFGLGNEYGVDEPFMAQEFWPGALSGAAGLVKYQPEFELVD